MNRDSKGRNIGYTNEEFLQKVNTKLDYIEVLDKYKGSKVKVRYKCLKCGYISSARAGSLMLGHGCPICTHAGKLPHKEFEKRIKEINPTIKILNKYFNGETVMDCMCLVCKNEWKTIARNLLRGCGCPKCNQSNPKLTTAEYISQMRDINPTIKIIGEYTGNNKRIDCKCTICGYEWSPFASAIKSRHGCPNCKALKDRLSREEFKNRVRENNPNFEILGEYQNQETKIRVKCLRCNTELLVSPQGLMKGKDVCKSCYRKGLLISNEEYKIRLKENNPYVAYIEEYKGMDKKIDVECLICGNIWKCTPARVLNGMGCPLCCLSKGEKEIAKILTKHNIIYIQQKEYKGLIGLGYGALSYDFYLPTYNLLIEYQGKQHEIPIDYFDGEVGFKTRQEHDRRKKEYAKEHNIQLLEIWYNENIEQKLKKTLNLETVETTGV